MKVLSAELREAQAGVQVRPPSVQVWGGQYTGVQVTECADVGVVSTDGTLTFFWVGCGINKRILTGP